MRAPAAKRVTSDTTVAVETQRSPFRFWSRLLTAVTGAVSLLAALRTVIQDSVSTLLLQVLDFYRQLVLGLFAPAFELFAITTNPATENYLVYAVFLCLNLWRAALSTIADWRSRYALTTVALALYLTLFWVFYFWAGNTPGRPLDEGKILWGSMIIAILAPVVGLLMPLALGYFVFLVGYFYYIVLFPFIWVLRKGFGTTLWRRFARRTAARFRKLWQLTSRSLFGESFGRPRVADRPGDAETVGDGAVGSILLRYMAGVGQGLVAALVVFLIGFAAS